LARSTRLPAKDVLIVEDEVLIAEDIAHEVRSRGGRTMGPLASTGQALEFLKSNRPDCVVLNALLFGERTTAVGSLLRELRVPFVVVTGYRPERLPPPLRAGPCIRKPFSLDNLIEAVGTVLRAPPQNPS